MRDHRTRSWGVNVIAPAVARDHVEVWTVGRGHYPGTEARYRAVVSHGVGDPNSYSTLGSSLCRRLTRIRTPPTGSLALHTRKDGVLAHPISRSPILAHSEAEHAISNAPGARGESQQIVTHMVAMSSPFTHSDSVSDTRHSRVLLGPLC